MTFKEFIGYIYEAVDCEGYIDRESEEIQTIEEVVGIDFKYLTNEEIFALIQRMKIIRIRCIIMYKYTTIQCQKRGGAKL